MDPGTIGLTPRFNRPMVFPRYRNVTFVNRRDRPHLVFDNDEMTDSLLKLTGEFDKHAATEMRNENKTTGYEKPSVQGVGNIASPMSDIALTKMPVGSTKGAEGISNFMQVPQWWSGQSYYNPVQGSGAPTTGSGARTRRGNCGGLALVTTKGRKPAISAKRSTRGNVLSKFA